MINSSNYKKSVEKLNKWYFSYLTQGHRLTHRLPLWLVPIKIFEIPAAKFDFIGTKFLCTATWFHHWGTYKLLTTRQKHHSSNITLDFLRLHTYKMKLDTKYVNQNQMDGFDKSLSTLVVDCRHSTVEIKTN